MQGESGPADAALLERFHRGDPAAFEELVDRYQAPLLRFARAVLPDASAAEDVVQETFLRFLRHAGGLRRGPGLNGRDAPLAAWLFRVCRNLAWDLMKTERREQERRRRLRPAPPEERDGAEGRELRELVGRELERLPAREREVLQRKVLEGQSYREIAEATGLKPGYIGWLIHQGLGRLHERLQAAGVLG